jgi:hypothetical protein
MGAKVAKWWIQKATAGTGDGDMTCYLVAANGTSGTRRVSGDITIDVDAAGPTYQEGYGSNAYNFAVTDLDEAVDIVFTSSTTNGNAPTGLSFGIIWGF